MPVNDPLLLLKKIIQSEYEKFALLDDSFKPFKLTSVCKTKDSSSSDLKEWQGEDDSGNRYIISYSDSFLKIGIGQNDYEALLNLKRIAYFNFKDVGMDDLVEYLQIEIPKDYSE